MRTSQQEKALQHHCRFAFETAHPRFGSVWSRLGVTVVLTVNSGYE
jgi:hypothetical protein